MESFQSRRTIKRKMNICNLPWQRELIMAINFLRWFLHQIKEQLIFNRKRFVIGVRPVFAKLVIEHAQHLFTQTLLSTQKNKAFFFTWETRFGADHRPSESSSNGLGLSVFSVSWLGDVVPSNELPSDWWCKTTFLSQSLEIHRCLQNS